jgi:hypothetical protein
MSAPFIYIGQHYVFSRFDLNIIFNLIDVLLAFKTLFIVIYMRYYYANLLIWKTKLRSKLRLTGQSFFMPGASVVEKYRLTNIFYS